MSLAKTLADRRISTLQQCSGPDLMIFGSHSDVRARDSRRG